MEGLGFYQNYFGEDPKLRQQKNGTAVLGRDSPDTRETQQGAPQGPEYEE